MSFLILLIFGTTSACAENTPLLTTPTECGGNYLRVRGEYYMRPWGINTPRELPPRARRIPNKNSSRVFTHRNYLRVRGEYRRVGAIRWSHRELPPRARRIHGKNLSVVVSDGTTSACAENTTTVLLQSYGRWNYLRVRGEYAEYWITDRDHGELPPRARRIRANAPIMEVSSGTTSACAENTPKELLKQK